VEHVERSLLRSDGQGAADELVKLFRTAPFVFESSGWVQKAVARVVLGHQDAAKVFLKAYWRERKKRPPEKELNIAVDASLSMGRDSVKHNGCETSPR
jgi:hypothetical protein